MMLFGISSLADSTQAKLKLNVPTNEQQLNYFELYENLCLGCASCTSPHDNLLISVRNRLIGWRKSSISDSSFLAKLCPDKASI